RIHLSGELGIGRRQPHAVRRFGEMDRIPRPDTQAGEHVLGQDDTGGVADLGDLERLVHTPVITEVVKDANVVVSSPLRGRIRRPGSLMPGRSWTGVMAQCPRRAHPHPSFANRLTAVSCAILPPSRGKGAV